MNKSEQVDILLELLTRYDFAMYEEINEELLKRGVDLTKIPTEKLAFSVNRFLADMRAKEYGLNAVQFVTPQRYACQKIERDTVVAKVLGATIFCTLSREYAGIFTYDKLRNNIQIIFDDERIYMISIEKI